MPGHAIPEPYCWDESFKVFYDNLDQEHKGLFDGVFACAGARGDKGKFDSLFSLVQSHFSNEEGMMKAKNYSNYASHKEIHDKFLADLKGLSLPLDDKAVDFAKSWLVNHIKDIDFKYKGQL